MICLSPRLCHCCVFGWPYRCQMKPMLRCLLSPGGSPDKYLTWSRTVVGQTNQNNFPHQAQQTRTPVVHHTELYQVTTRNEQILHQSINRHKFNKHQQTVLRNGTDRRFGESVVALLLLPLHLWSPMKVFLVALYLYIYVKPLHW